ncbi:MAG: hypothetical protein JXR71_11000 [Bacteroidales bacterium]|nr:hypothetical protein [Bacteroidales bacterium]
MHRRTQLIILFLLFMAPAAWAQSLPSFQPLMPERYLYTMNKQVNQFVHRFNMEEDPMGRPLEPTDKRYHNNALRKKVLPLLFDMQNPRTSGKLQKYFIDDVTNPKHPVFLNFLDKNWYAEVSATFKDEKGEDVNLILFLTVEKEGLGSKWIISNVYDTDLKALFPRETEAGHMKYFLHPQSHEIDFMNLNKALDDPEHIEYYAATDYHPDYLTLFFYLMKKGKLHFEQINSVKFHFLQIKNWYFELKYFNRDSENSGWLISDLKYISDKEKANIIRFYRSCSTD